MNGTDLPPSRTLVTSFNPKTTTASQLQANQLGSDYFEEGDWVLCVASSSDSFSNPAWIGCALSNGEVQTYDQTKLHSLHTYHHDSLVTDLVRDVSNPYSLIASSADGTVTIYDIRQGQNAALQVKLPRLGEEALSVSIGFNGTIAAVGSNKAKIHFFDLRGTGGVLGTYNQSHTNEITRVRFQTIPSSPGNMMGSTTPILVSAAEDGLACVYDTSQITEEAAIQNVLAVQSPVREIGFFGPQSEGIYCMTGSESLQLYHKDDSVCRRDFGPNMRQHLTQMLVEQCGGHDDAQRRSITNIDYLVDCHWDQDRQSLQLLVGNGQGDTALYQVGEHGVSFMNRLRGGHRGVVRAWNFLSSNVFVTVGEDARMCEWNRASNVFGAADSGTIPTSSLLPHKGTEILVANGAAKRGNMVWAKPGGGKLRRPRSRMSASPY